MMSLMTTIGGSLVDASISYYTTPRHTIVYYTVFPLFYLGSEGFGMGYPLLDGECPNEGSGMNAWFALYTDTSHRRGSRFARSRKSILCFFFPLRKAYSGFREM